MPFYEDMQNVARDVLAEFKQGEIIYVHSTPGTGPADDPGQPTLTEHEIDGAANGVKFKYVQAGQAIASDLQVVSSVNPDYTPNVSGFVKIDGTRYKIHKLLPKPAAGVPVAFVFILRK